VDGILWDVATGKRANLHSAGKQMAFRADGQVAFAAAHERGQLGRIDTSTWMANTT
jgi:hypothetical protein